AAALGCRDRAEAVQRQGALRELVRQRMPALEQVTGLKFKRDPAVAPRSRAQVRDYIIHKFDEDLPPAELAGLQQTLRLFGFVPDTLDLRESFADVLTEQIGGYFDPDSNTLYVPTDIDSFIVRTSVTHELVHALQGQYVNLDSLLELKHANDRRSAAQAVLEGQATLVQTLVMMPEQRLEQLPSFWEARVATMAQQRRMPAFAHASRWLRETLIFPYLAGADFVRWYATTHPGGSPTVRRCPCPPSRSCIPIATQRVTRRSSWRSCPHRPIPSATRTTWASSRLGCCSRSCSTIAPRSRPPGSRAAGAATGSGCWDPGSMRWCGTPPGT